MTEIPATKAEVEEAAHLAAIVASACDAILSETPEGIITSWNHGAEALLGYGADEAVGRDASFLTQGIRPEGLHELAERVIRGGPIRNLQTEFVSKEGRNVEVSLALSPIFDGNGCATGISVIARESLAITRANPVLSEGERYYRTLVEMAPDPVLVHRGGRFLYANCAALGIFCARNLHELQRHTLFELIHPADRGLMHDSITAVNEGEEVSLVEFRLPRPDGGERSIECSSTLIDYDGEPAIQVLARDVSERKAAEAERDEMTRELAFQQNRFEAVVEQLPVGVVIAEAPSGRVIYKNELTRAIFQLPPEELETVSDLNHWKMYRLDGNHVPPGEIPLMRAIEKGETVLGEEFLILRGNGSRGFVSINATPLRDISGRIISGLATISDVTENRAAAKALSDSQERLKLALDAAEMGSCDMDVTTGRGTWSRRHYLLLGYPPPEEDPGPAATAMWQDRIHPDDKERVMAALDTARREHEQFRSEHRILKVDDGKMLWVDVIGRFLCDPTGAACRFIGVIFDVTGRKTTEEALFRSAQRLRALADSMPQIVWTADADGAIDYLNAHFESYTGIDRRILERYGGSPGELIARCVHPEDRERTARLWEQAVQTGTSYQNEQRILANDGTYRWHLSRATAERDEEGKVVKWYGTATDIDDLRKTQEKLGASETRFRWLYESNLIAIFFWSSDGRIIDANDACCALMGYSVHECRSGNLYLKDLTDPADVGKDRAAMDEIMTRGISKTYEKLFVNPKSGETIATLTAIARMAGTEGGGIGFAVDLTDLKRAEQALKESEATLKLAVETTGLGIFDLDLADGSGVWSPIAKGHYGLPPDSETDLATMLERVHPEDRARFERIVQDAKIPTGGGVYSAEYRTVGLVDGKIRWLSMRAKVSYRKDGRPARLVGACLNVTDNVIAQEALREEMTERLRAVEELRRQEQLLLRQGRLAAMGEMIANIAHQWRQPLNTLGLIVQELPTYYDQKLFSRQYLETSVERAMQVISYMSQTIDGFRNFFGPAKEKQPFKAAEILEQTLAILQGTFAAAKITVEMEADRDAEAFGIPNEYSQVLLNVLMNAKDALTERKVEPARIEIRLFREKQRTVLTVEDNAGGIPEEIVEKIFDPYFTTKGPDKGTGIGLFMSKTIIEKNMNGALSVCNTWRGALFRIEV